MLSGIFLTSIAILFSTVVNAGSVADASLWMHNTFSQQACESLNDKEVASIQTQLNSAKQCHGMRANPYRALLSGNDLAENDFFQNEAEAQMQQMDCDIQTFALLQKAPELVQAQAKNIALKLPLLQSEMRAASEKYAVLLTEREKRNQYATYCRTRTGTDLVDCNKELKLKDQALKEYENFWQSHVATVTGTVNSVAYGHTETIADFLIKAANKNPLPTETQIFSELQTMQPELKEELDSNRQALVAQGTYQDGKIIFNNLNDKTKIQLVEASLINGILSKKLEAKDPAFAKLGCRLEGKYTKGRDKIEGTFVVATLLVGGFGGAVAKAGLAARATTTASLFSRARSAQALLKGVTTVMSTALAVNALNKACVSEDANITAAKRCPTDVQELKDLEIERRAYEDCLLSAAIELTPAALFASAAVAKKLAGQLKNSWPEIAEAKQIAKRRLRAQRLFNNTLTETQLNGIEEAHRIGRGKMGADGTTAGIGNYTFAQKKAKVAKLKELGLTDKAHRRLLFERGIVGDSLAESRLYSMADTLDKLESAALKDRRLKLDTAEVDGLRDDITELLVEGGAVKPEIVKAIEERVARLKASMSAPFAAAPQSSQATLTVEYIKNSKKFEDLSFSISTDRGLSRKILVTKAVQEDLQKADSMVVEKLTNSLKAGLQADMVNAEKVRIIDGILPQRNGKVFEVRIVNKGHQRLFGCVQNGVYTILRYDSHAPEVASGTKTKYLKLCD